LKRILSHCIGGNYGGADGDSEDDDLTLSQRSKLQRRLVPGLREGQALARHPVKGGKPDEVEARSEAASDEEDEDDLTDDDDDDAEDSELEAQTLEVDAERAKVVVRGNFQCKLCPDKVLINEKLMEQHMQSEYHKRNERRFQRAQELGLEGYIKECEDKKAAKRAIAEGGADKVATKRQLRREAWRKRKDEKKRDRVKKNKLKKTTEEEKPEKGLKEASRKEWSAKKKDKLEEKKARRLAKRSHLQEQPQLATAEETRSEAVVTKKSKKRRSQTS